MTTWILLFISLQIIHFLGTWKLYKKANHKAWEAIVPIYNLFILTKIIDRPKWWIVLLFIPVINLLILPVLWVDIVRVFGKTERKDTYLAYFTFGFYVAYLNYTGSTLVYNRKQAAISNKTDCFFGFLIYAIVTATLVHTYIIQPFVIPSSSLEKSLLVGDFLLVSKVHYGARLPITPIALPMIHDTVPILKTKSYLFNDHYDEKKISWLQKLQLPYFRLPGFQKIKRNDIVTFNQPADTLLDMNDFHPKRNYYKPIDKKTNLVKRCVAIPGDTLEIKAGYVYINGKKTQLPKRAKPQYNFFVDTKGKALSQKLIKDVFGARDGLKYANGNFGITKSGGYILTLTDKEAELVTEHNQVNNVIKLLAKKGQDGDVFPHISKLGWNIDNYGPIYIPKKGETIIINKDNLPFYKRIISEYEGNTLQTHKNKLIVNGKETNNYTFKQDYYWMMGDNRQNSLDARYWGYVPFDHVIGKPVFIWLSIEKEASKLFNKIRWNRLFTTVNGDTESKSYFIHFLIFILTYYTYKEIKKRNLKKK